MSDESHSASTTRHDTEVMRLTHYRESNGVIITVTRVHRHHADDFVQTVSLSESAARELLAFLLAHLS